jgi:hypothetical protein
MRGVLALASLCETQGGGVPNEFSTRAVVEAVLGQPPHRKKLTSLCCKSPNQADVTIAYGGTSPLLQTYSFSMSHTLVFAILQSLIILRYFVT